MASHFLQISWKFLLLIVGAGALQDFGAVVVVRLNRRPHQPGDRCWLEDRDQPERLGATSGGGTVATVNF
jgi:hypothetical protein